MKAVWLADGRPELREVPVPKPAPGEVLVKVLRAGICNTDLELIRGYYAFDGILGHEFAGVVEQGPGALEGRRVAGEINVVCGKCIECHSGRSTHCLDRSVLGIVDRNGAFAEYLVLPDKNLHVVPERVSTDEAVFTEPLAAALQIQEQVRVGQGDRVLVVGAGKLGQLVVRTLCLTGARVTVLDRNPGKLELLAATGATTSSDIAEIDPVGFDLAVECTGDQSGFDIALDALRPRGTLVLKSTYAGKLNHDASRIVVNEITVVGSRCGPFGKALALLEARKIKVTDLIDGRYALEAGLEALEHAARRGGMKVVIGG